MQQAYKHTCLPLKEAPLAEVVANRASREMIRTSELCRQGKGSARGGKTSEALIGIEWETRASCQYLCPEIAQVGRSIGVTK